MTAADSVNSDVAHFSFTEKELSRINEGEFPKFNVRLVAIVHSERNHPINQPLHKMLPTVKAAISWNDANYYGLVSDWTEALAAMELPDTTVCPY